MTTKKIAIDVGGVLIIRKENKKTHFTGGKKKKTFLAKEEKKIIETAQLFSGVKEIIRLLAESKKYELFILSYCQKDTETRTIKILEANEINLFIPQENWIFVSKRNQKAIVCQEKNFDIMIDDREDILREILKLNPSMTVYWFHEDFLPEKQMKNHTYFKTNSFQIIKDWYSIQAFLLP